MTTDPMNEAVEAAARAITDACVAHYHRDYGYGMFTTETSQDIAQAALDAALPILRAQFAEESAAAIRADRQANIQVGTQAFGAMTQAAAIAHDLGVAK